MEMISDNFSFASGLVTVSEIFYVVGLFKSRANSYRSWVRRWHFHPPLFNDDKGSHCNRSAFNVTSISNSPPTLDKAHLPQ